MNPTARLGDPIGHGGSITSGSGNVFINGIPAAVVGMSLAVCSIHPSAQAVVQGSSTVTINNIPAAYVSGLISCGAPIVVGSPDVLIGG